jgi:hypothetical protein
MSQTERDFATINSLLGNNTTGEISPQDIRDAFASLQGYGCMILSAGGSGSITGVGTSYSLVDIYDTISAKSIDVNSAGVNAELAPNFQITINATGFYRVAFYASFSSTANNKLITFREFKNGSPGIVEVDRWIGTGSDTGVVSFEDIESESVGDVIDMRVKIDSGTTDLTFLAAAMTVHRVG